MSHITCYTYYQYAYPMPDKYKYLEICNYLTLAVQIYQTFEAFTGKIYLLFITCLKSSYKGDSHIKLKV